jgi:hypothetical protein
VSEVSLQLLPRQRETLLAAVPQSADIWNALRYAFRPTSGSLDDACYEVLCDAAGAEVLLHFARSHCPDAVEALEVALQRSRSIPH